MYQLLQREEDLMLVIEPQATEPDGPMLIYDGGDTALLFRNWDSSIRLNGLSQQARQPLTDAADIYVVEKHGQDILRDYMARVRIVRDVRSLMM